MTSHLGIDIGTSSVKAVLIDSRQNFIAEGSAPLDVSRPQPLWSEQDPESWWSAAQTAVGTVRTAAPREWSALTSIGLSGQQHGATLLDATGKALRPCILWNDGRAGLECSELLESVADFTTRSLNTTMPGFTAPKLLWVAKHEPDIFAKTAKILLPKDYVRFRLSGEYASEMSDSAGTLWLNVAQRRWDATLLAACGLKEAQMPYLVEGSAVSACLSPQVAADWGLAGCNVLIAGGGGDNACSAVGVGAARAGDGFLSLGTSGVIFAVTNRPAALPERTLHAFCHALPDRWHGMVVALSAASALSWIAAITGAGGDTKGLLARVERFASDSRRRAHAPVFLPYLTGERTPHNDPHATAAFGGLTVDHGPEAMVYAVIEGVAFALRDCLDVLVEAGAAPTSCMMVGGGSRSLYWAQLLADATGLTLDLPQGAELGAAFGAARLGMIAAGVPEQEACVKPTIRTTFSPDRTNDALLRERAARVRELYRRKS
ncbi:xylulokinase [Bradyrhizobium sp. CB2312]|uniref:xylulokinase n=1 Tax=Bradyrhizobium sp. CB2312 TaxID=3039155 RepID=UPI0024B09C98|nr:xylulokinase [Bradyrhizobium sp. CB2312]WFU74768.1 xylulokinase [Bradyrhizobium sp. CB2312]